VDDPDAEMNGLIRVIDESGEDYVYPAGLFQKLTLPAEIQRALRPASEAGADDPTRSSEVAVSGRPLGAWFCFAGRAREEHEQRCIAGTPGSSEAEGESLYSLFR
jgi:hypothetical protein